MNGRQRKRKRPENGSFSIEQEATVTTRKTGKDKGSAKKLKLKKETLGDLDARGRKVKGGALVAWNSVDCNTNDVDCTMWTCRTACGQLTCATGNVFCNTYGCATSGCKLKL